MASGQPLEIVQRLMPHPIESVRADLHIVIPFSLAQSRILNLNLASIDPNKNNEETNFWEAV